MKEESKAIGWLISSTARFIFALLILLGVVLGIVYLLSSIKTGNVKGILICCIPVLFIIAHLLDKYWWRNTKKYHELMKKHIK